MEFVYHFYDEPRVGDLLRYKPPMLIVGGTVIELDTPVGWNKDSDGYYWRVCTGDENGQVVFPAHEKEVL